MNKPPRNEQTILLVKDILYNSLAQAIIKIIQTPHLILKLVLSIFVVLASGLASYLIIKSVVSYFAYEVTTMTRTIFETPAPFPKVTFCNSNPFTTEYALDFLKRINHEINPNTSLFDEDHLKPLNYKDKSELASKIHANGIAKMKSFPNRTRLAHTFSDIFLSCKFNNQLCNENNFTHEFDFKLGNCFVFNSVENPANVIKSYIAGKENGLKVTLYSNFHENLSFINSVNGELGAKIRIDNSTYLIDDTDSSIQISTGLKTEIIVERTFQFNLPKPYSNCDLDNDSPNYSTSEFFNMIDKSAYVYDQQLCLKQCRQKYYLFKCNCTSSRLLSLFNRTHCETNEQVKCRDEMQEYFFKTNIIQKRCLPLCPLECNRTEFRMFTSASKLIGDSFVDYIKNNENLRRDFVTRQLDANSARNSITKIYIFYESLFYTMSTESPKIDLVLLVAYIGGILGLFLGVSVLSICEIVELLIEIYFVQKKSAQVKF